MDISYKIEGSPGRFKEERRKVELESSLSIQHHWVIYLYIYREIEVTSAYVSNREEITNVGGQDGTDISPHIYMYWYIHIYSETS